MQCYVYKSEKKQDHFLFVAKQFEGASPPEVLPVALLEMLGELSLVVDFDLTESRKLPNSEAGQVLEALIKNGFYLQMPKESMNEIEELYFN